MTALPHSMFTLIHSGGGVIAVTKVATYLAIYARRMEAPLRMPLQNSIPMAYNQQEIERALSVVEGKLVDTPRKKIPHSEKNDVKVIQTAILPNLVDIVKDGDKHVFLFIGEHGLEVVHHVEPDSETQLVPPQPQHIHWTIARANQVIEHYQKWLDSPKQENQKLFDDLVAYHKSISELPRNVHYDLLAAYDMHTYLQEHFQYSPLLCLFAVAERGKTRTLKGIIHVAYRGVRVTSMREAFVFRLAQRLNATLFFDVSDVWKQARRYGCEDILLNRFEKGSNVPRINHEKEGFDDTKMYEVFGPTLLATNYPIHDILDTRAVTITMQDSERRFEDDVMPEHGLALRERLTAFRAYYLNRSLPHAVKPTGGRLGDILRPLMQIIAEVKPTKESAFIELSRDLKESSKKIKADSFEGQLIRVVLAREPWAEHGILAVKDIVDDYNRDKLDRYKITPQKAGRIFQALGFYNDQKPTTANGSAAIPLNTTLLNNLAIDYGITEAPEMSETSEINDSLVGDTEVSDVTDDEPESNNQAQLPNMEGGDSYDPDF